MDDVKSNVSEYPRIASELRQSILRGIYDNEKHLFPSEMTLADQYSVSRSTIRKALELLKSEGLIEKHQGKRIMVSLRKLKFTSWNFSSFSERLRALNDEPFSRVDAHEIITIEDTKYFHLQRTRGVARGKNVQFLSCENSLVPLAIFPGIDKHDFARESLYEVMRSYRVYPCQGRSRLTAILAEEQLARDFDIPEGTPLIRAFQEITDFNDRIIEKVTITYAPELEIRLVRDAGH